MYNFDSYNVLLSIATNIAVLLMTLLCCRDTYMKNHKYLWKYLKPYDLTQSESQGIYKSVKCFYALFIFIYDVLYVIKKQK